MHAFTINNPEMAQLAEEVFGKEPISNNEAFYRFLQEQKIKQDAKESVKQAVAGEYLNEEDTFQQLFTDLGL